MRVPKLDELPWGIGELFAGLGITDADLPDILPDDIDLTDPQVAAEALPLVTAKLGVNHGL